MVLIVFESLNYILIYVLICSYCITKITHFSVYNYGNWFTILVNIFRVKST